MNSDKILASTRIIQEQEKALRWLETCGSILSDKDAVNVRVEIRLKSAQGNGSMQAASILSEYVISVLPDALLPAIKGCRAIIANERAAIQRELMETVK